MGGAEFAAGSGLRGMADRVMALGGSMELDSPAGEGTRIEARLALEGRGVGHGALRTAQRVDE